MTLRRVKQENPEGPDHGRVTDGSNIPGTLSGVCHPAPGTRGSGPWKTPILADASRWGAAYAQGIASLAAHFVWSTPGLGADSAAARGAVVSERAGDLQIGYAALPSDSASDAWLATSVYGQRYLTLRRMIGLGALVAP